MCELFRFQLNSYEGSRVAARGPSAFYLANP